MNLKELKTIAKNNNLEFAKNANTAQMTKLLQENGLMPESKETSYDNLDHDFKTLVYEYKVAESAIDIKKADQKRSVLRVKLNDHPEKLIDFLKWERSRKIISVGDNYLLNELEKEKLDKRCTCIREIPSGGTHEQVGEEYPYLNYYDESRQMDMFTIYIDRTIAPEAQIDKKLAWKMSKGFMPQESDYAPEKVVWHRMTLNENEFNKYFKVDEL